MPGMCRSSTTSSYGSPALAAAVQEQQRVLRGLGLLAARHARDRDSRARSRGWCGCRRPPARAGPRERRARVPRRPRGRGRLDARGEAERAPLAGLATWRSARRPSARRAGARSPGRARCRRSAGWSRCPPARTASNRRGRRSGAMPMPVSVTATSSSRSPPSSGVGAGAHRHLAGLGELDRVGHEVDEHLAQAAAVAAHDRRHLLVDPARSARRPWRAPGGRASRTRPRPRRAVDVVEVELQLAGLDLREVEDVVDDAEQRVARRSRPCARTRAGRASARCPSAARACPSRR